MYFILEVVAFIILSYICIVIACTLCSRKFYFPTIIAKLMVRCIDFITEGRALLHSKIKTPWEQCKTEKFLKVVVLALSFLARSSEFLFYFVLILQFFAIPNSIRKFRDSTETDAPAMLLRWLHMALHQHQHQHQHLTGKAMI